MDMAGIGEKPAMRSGPCFLMVCTIDAEMISKAVPSLFAAARPCHALAAIAAGIRDSQQDSSRHQRDPHDWLEPVSTDPAMHREYRDT